MIGLHSTGSVYRRAQTGQGSDGSPTISTTLVWTGKCLVRRSSGSAKYRALGMAGIGKFIIDMPQVAGIPIIGDEVRVGSDVYKVEFVDPGSEGLNHHWELVCTRATP